MDSSNFTTLSICSRRLRSLPSIPPSTMTTCPVTCPETIGEASITIWCATSEGIAILRRGVLRIELIDVELVSVNRLRRKCLIYSLWVIERLLGHGCIHPSRGNAVCTCARSNFYDFVLEGKEKAIHQACVEHPGLGIRDCCNWAITCAYHFLTLHSLHDRLHHIFLRYSQQRQLRSVPQTRRCLLCLSHPFLLF